MHLYHLTIGKDWINETCFVDLDISVYNSFWIELNHTFESIDILRIHCGQSLAKASSSFEKCYTCWAKMFIPYGTILTFGHNLCKKIELWTRLAYVVHDVYFCFGGSILLRVCLLGYVSGLFIAHWFVEIINQRLKHIDFMPVKYVIYQVLMLHQNLSISLLVKVRKYINKRYLLFSCLFFAPFPLFGHICWMKFSYLSNYQNIAHKLMKYCYPY